jgi:cell division protein FtsQ
VAGAPVAGAPVVGSTVSPGPVVWTEAEAPVSAGVGTGPAGESIPAGAGPWPAAQAGSSVVSLADRAGTRWPQASADTAAAGPGAGFGAADLAARPATATAAGAARPATGDQAEAVPAAPGAATAAGEKSGPGKGRSARRSKRSGRDPWRTAFFAVLALAIVGGAAWALLGSSLLVVRHEQVTGNRLVPAAKVLAAAGIRRGTPLASVNTTAAARRVEQIAQVRSARVTRSFPNTVVISVRERTPSLAVRAAGGYALTDSSGVTIRWSARKPAGLPVLRQPPAQLRGDPGVRAAAAVLARLPHHLRTLVVAVSAPTAAAVTLTLRSGVTVLWGSPAKDAVKAAEVTVLLRTHARYLDVSDPAMAVTHR